MKKIIIVIFLVPAPLGAMELHPIPAPHERSGIAMYGDEHIVVRIEENADCCCSKELICGLGALLTLAGFVIWLLAKTAPH